MLINATGLAGLKREIAGLAEPVDVVDRDARRSPIVNGRRWPKPFLRSEAGARRGDLLDSVRRPRAAVVNVPLAGKGQV
jgi:hypothetical protein